jgi:hypothetical protein
MRAFRDDRSPTVFQKTFLLSLCVKSLGELLLVREVEHIKPGTLFVEIEKQSLPRSSTSYTKLFSINIRKRYPIPVMFPSRQAFATFIFLIHQQLCHPERLLHSQK